MSIIDMGKRACRHCGKPTGSLTRTCSDPRCVFKQARGRMNSSVAVMITQAHAEDMARAKENIQARGDHIIYEDHETVISSGEVLEPISDLIARSSLGPTLASKKYGPSPHTPVHGDLPHVIRRRGWCPECKEKLSECTCSGERGTLFDEE